MEIYAIVKVNDKGIISKDKPLLFYNKKSALNQLNKLGDEFMLFEANKWERILQ